MGEANLSTRVVFSVPTSKQKVGNVGQGIPAPIGFCLSSTESELGKRRRDRRERQNRKEGRRKRTTIH